jgi:hypothetical protein
MHSEVCVLALIDHVDFPTLSEGDPENIQITGLSADKRATHKKNLLRAPFRCSLGSPTAALRVSPVQWRESAVSFRRSSIQCNCVNSTRRFDEADSHIFRSFDSKTPEELRL